MLLSTLLLATAGTSAGCFNGGALVGAQAGFMRAILKQAAKATPIKEDEAKSKIDSLAAAGIAVSSKDAYAKASEGLDKDLNYTIKIDANGLDKTKDEDKKALIAKYVAAFNAASVAEGIKTAKTVKVLVLVNDEAAKAFGDADLNTARSDKSVTDLLTEENKKKLAKALVASDAEVKYTSNNGFAGIHAGYLGRVNDKFLVGGLVEGNWVFGQDMKVDSNAIKDTNARFNVNVFLRAMFNLTEKFMAGADLGFSGQEIRQLKAPLAAGTTAKSSDKESKWFWNPAARLVLGVALTENILATAHFGGVFPMMKQDSLDKSVKAKYSNFHGGVGISYAFGG